MIEAILNAIPAHVQPEMEIWGRRVALADFAGLRCACGGDCPNLRLADLHHLCIDVKNASGNLHKDAATGEFWIEFHLDACCSIFNHLHSGDWYRWGIGDEQYRALMMSQSLQQFGGTDISGVNWRAHLCVQLRAGWVEKVTSAERVAEFAQYRNSTPEEAKARIYDMIAWVLAGQMYARATLELNHGLLDRSSFGSQSVRLWAGAEAEMEKTIAAIRANPALRLPVMRDGKVHLLETGSIPARRRFFGQPPLPALGPVQPSTFNLQRLLQEENP